MSSPWGSSASLFIARVALFKLTLILIFKVVAFAEPPKRILTLVVQVSPLFPSLFIISFFPPFIKTLILIFKVVAFAEPPKRILTLVVQVVAFAEPPKRILTLVVQKVRRDCLRSFLLHLVSFYLFILSLYSLLSLPTLYSSSRV